MTLEPWPVEREDLIADLGIFEAWTVHTRSLVVVFFGVFVALGLAQPMLIGFGVIDLLAALWTNRALRD